MISPWELLVYSTQFQYLISETKKKQYKYAIKKKPAGGKRWQELWNYFLHLQMGF